MDNRYRGKPRGGGAVRDYKYNGEYWYCDNRSIFTRIRQWFIWLGGWELANGRGWRFWIPHNTINGTKKLWMSPYPISLLGHRMTFYGWGMEIKLSSGWIVWNFNRRYCFISRNGTPNDAHRWLWGCPAEIKIEADKILRRRII